MEPEQRSHESCLLDIYNGYPKLVHKSWWLIYNASLLRLFQVDLIESVQS